MPLITLRACVPIRPHSRCHLSTRSMPQPVRPEFEMRDLENAALCSAEPSSTWSGFKNIQISEEIETTCSSLGTGRQVMCSRFLALKALANIMQPFTDTRNASGSVQRITSLLQRRAMDSCSLLHRQNPTRGVRLRSAPFRLGHHDQYGPPHCGTQACWGL